MVPRCHENGSEGSERINRARSILSLRCLQSFDKHVYKIIYQIPFVALYQMDPLQKKWKKLDIEGGLHMTQRMLPASVTAEARTPCCGTLVLKRHEQPVRKQPYLRYSTEGQSVEQNEEAGIPVVSAVNDSLRGDTGMFRATPEDAKTQPEKTCTAGNGEIGYRFFILNQCREEIFFQDVASNFEFEANERHILYKVWNPSKVRV